MKKIFKTIPYFIGALVCIWVMMKFVVITLTLFFLAFVFMAVYSVVNGGEK